MHADEVDTDASLVRRLLAAQFPHWAGLPITPVPSTGTDNALYRLGDDMVVRLPRIAWAIAQVEKERHWLPRLAPRLPLAIPIPLAKGEPGEGYPWHWSVYRWLAGENPTIQLVADRSQVATDLAHFITALQQVDLKGGPLPGQHNFFRGVPLSTRDAATRVAIAVLHREIDVRAVTEAWEASLRAPEWLDSPVWIHGDLSTGNLLVQGGRLSGVIDFGCLGVGDPACDLMIAWTLFSGESRGVFHAALAVDDATWLRGRGWALSCALMFIPYYRETIPVGVDVARRTIDEVLADHSASGGAR